MLTVPFIILRNGEGILKNVTIASDRRSRLSEQLKQKTQNAGNITI
jgi:hypothetical protein